jgi:aryl-phospho-beta-D-glucosidase BglC (GH1 family)
MILPAQRSSLFIIAAFITCCTACRKDPISFQPDNKANESFVHVADGRLLDGDKNPLTIKAVNLGGWLMWESWIWGGGLNSETSVMKTIAEKTSPAYAETFRQRIYREFITKDDIRDISLMGMNAVRVPFNHSFFDNGSNGNAPAPAAFTIIDSLISWCRFYKVFIILDSHGLPGGQNPLFISDPDPVKVWASDENKLQAARIWKAIAERYADEKILLGFDLMNEPAPTNDVDMVNLYSSIIKSIRSVDNNHLLIIEGSDYAKNFSIFNTVMDNNQIYSFHFYPWLMSQEAKVKQLQEFNAFANKVKTPMWCGEWGEAAPAELHALRVLLSDNSYNFCGTAYWTWKKVKLSASSYPINQVVVTDQWSKLINNQAKTSADTYEQIAEGFLQAIKLKNCVADNNLKSILGN